MNHISIRIPRKVSDVKRQNSLEPVKVHRRDDAGVVHILPRDPIRCDKPLPFMEDAGRLGH